MQVSVRHNSDISSGIESKKSQLEKRNNQLGGSHRMERADFDVKHHQKSDRDIYGKRRRGYDVGDVIKKRRGRNGIDDDSDNKIENHIRNRRHDSDDENPDSGYGRKNYKASSGRPKAIENQPPSNDDSDHGNRNRSDFDKGSSDSDSDHGASDYRHKRNGKNFVGKNRSGRGDGVNGRSVQSDQGHTSTGSDRKGESGRNDDDDTFETLRKLEEKSLSQSRRDFRDKERSTYEHQETRMANRKYDVVDREEQLGASLRSRIVGKDAEHKGHPADTKKESELNTSVCGNKDDLKGDDWDNKEHAGAFWCGKDEEEPRGGRHQKDEEEEPRGGRPRRDEEEEPRGGRHRRDEEEDNKYRRHRKDGEELQRESRRRVRGEEEERGSRRHGRVEEGVRGSQRHGRREEEERGSKRNEREIQGDYSKKVRYDDSRSSERKKYEHKREDDRGRRRD